MKAYELIVTLNRQWQVAELYRHEDGVRTLVCVINKFYEVTPDWILIYDEKGPSYRGYIRGDLIRKVYIGDSEFYTVEITEPEEPLE